MLNGRLRGRRCSDLPADSELCSRQSRYAPRTWSPRKVPAGSLNTKRLFGSANVRVRDPTLIRQWICIGPLQLDASSATAVMWAVSQLDISHRAATGNTAVGVAEHGNLSIAFWY
jgi:hypothetical protein